MKCVSVLGILINLFIVHNRNKIVIGAIPQGYCRTPSQGMGDCILLAHCEPILNFIDTHQFTNEIGRNIRKYLCGYVGARRKVCCPRNPREIDGILESAVNPETHPNRELLPTLCGPSTSEGRINMGDTTELFEFPWAAIFKYDDKNNPWKCGGSLINDRYILTAAHCIRSKYKLLQVRLGEYDLNKDRDCIQEDDEEPSCAPPVQDFDISIDDAIVHPEYDSRTQANDIALVRLRKAADITGAAVTPICLPITEQQRTHKYDIYTVIGWGITEKELSSSVLLKVLIPPQKLSKCAAVYPKTTVTDRHICAGGRNNKDSCKGDSGGPLSGEHFNELGQVKVVQYGIVSLGPVICAREGFPTLYTKVADYVGWILNTIKP